jgi:FkbM family methyltransferase
MGITASDIKSALINFGAYRTFRHVQRLLSSEKSLAFSRRQAFFRSVVPKSSMCFDVGANIGSLSEIFLSNGYKVVAFEPQDICRRELKARCSHFPNFDVMECALAGEEGSKTLHLRANSGQASMVEDWEGEKSGSISVPVSTLDAQMLRWGRPYYCKIDVEGFEWEVLGGLSQSIPLLSIEYHTSEAGLLEASRCLERLKSIGFTRVNVLPEQEYVFALQEWQPIDAMIVNLKQILPSDRALPFGELFVS